MTSEEMETTLASLGIKVLSNRGSELQASCPAHKDRTGHEDRNPSWWINADTGQHICFSCHFKGSLYGLISYVKGIDFDKAKDWMDSPDALVQRFHRVTNEKKQPIEEPSLITESMLSAFVDPPAEALTSRGLLLTSAQHYQVLWDHRKNNWILPVRDLQGKLLGWQEKGFASRYFNNQPPKMKKSHSLFGYQQYKGGDMIVVESPLDTVRLHSLGFTGGVATMGALVSQSQLNAIRGADRIIFAMDNDLAGTSSSVELLNKCQEMGVEAWFFNYQHTDMKDVGAMSLDEIRLGLEKAKHIAQGKKAVV